MPRNKPPRDETVARDPVAPADAPAARSADPSNGDPGSARRGTLRLPKGIAASDEGEGRGGPAPQRPGLRARFNTKAPKLARPAPTAKAAAPDAAERRHAEAKPRAPRPAAPKSLESKPAAPRPAAPRARTAESGEAKPRPAGARATPPRGGDDRASRSRAGAAGEAQERRGPSRSTAPRIGETRAGEARKSAKAVANVVATRPPAADAPPEGVRLSKVMAERGLCSRREADGFIERGWVIVNGQRVSELGTRIDPAADVALAPEAQWRQSTQVTILLHKPVGYVSGQPEPGYEPAVTLIGADNQFDRASAQRFHPAHLKGLAPAGRLDIDSTGLLVLTQNGRIARQLIGDDSKIEKEYIVRVEGELDDEGLALLEHGLELDGRKLRPAKVEWINDRQLRFVLREGRKRQIRRMCELVGLKVVGLKRTRIGRVKLADLPLGQWRFLREDEQF